jgi:type IV pilus assembly protein PilX
MIMFKLPIPQHQSGAVLVVSLIMLLLLTIIGVTSMQTTSLEEKMAGNMRDKNLAFQAAESALSAAEASLNPPAALPTFVPAGTDGFYSETPTPDLSDSEIVKDSFWTTNPVATSTVASLGNGIVSPLYIIQKMGTTDCPGAPAGSGGCSNFRITVRATGGTTNAVAILQSIYLP